MLVCVYAMAARTGRAIQFCAMSLCACLSKHIPIVSRFLFFGKILWFFPCQTDLHVHCSISFKFCLRLVFVKKKKLYMFKFSL